MPHALLIDGENISSTHAPAVLAAIPEDCAIRRVYGDVSRINGWAAVPGLNVIHVPAGRNAADIRLAIDAVALSVAERATGFTLATSDGGLGSLVIFLRETGRPVTLVCTTTASASLRLAASQVVALADPPKARAAAPVPAAPPSEPSARLDAFLLPKLREAGQEGLTLAARNPLVQRELQLKISDLPERTWRTYLVARAGRFRCDPRGPDARVFLARPS